MFSLDLVKMGGYDCCLFKKEEVFPDSVKLFEDIIREKMFEKSGRDEREFNSIWYNLESSFRIFFSDGDLWGVLDW